VALSITASLEIANFFTSMDVLTDLRGDNIVYRGGVLIQKLEDWKNY
jgi:hypothetical protein